MPTPTSLFLYEEVILLALREEEGTFATGFVEQVVAGAVLAELLLDERIAVDENDKKQDVAVLDASPFGDPIIDEALGMLAESDKPRPFQTWVGRLAGVRDLRHKVARRLCDHGILRADEDKVLWIFTRRIYPEVDPVPERAIIDRLRHAVEGDDENIDARTVVLISLVHKTGLLRLALGADTVNRCKERIESIINGEVTGKATRQVIAACQSAMWVAAMMPIFASS